ELDGKWTAAGFESLGFSARPTFAIYGLGLQPLVARLEVKDHKAVQATIERIAAKAGKTLPPIETRDGRNYWKIVKPDGTTAAVIGFADNQVIAAVGTAADIDAKLGVILGTEKPAQTMADGVLVKELMTRHGMGPHLIGFGDTRRIAALGAQAAGAKLSPACSSEVERLGAKVPRVVIGYAELSGARTTGGMVFELAPDVASELRALKVEIPGLGAALSDQPAMAFAAGIDLARGQQLALSVAGTLKRLGETCEIAELAHGAGEAQDSLSRPLPAPAGQILGVVVAVREVELAAGGQGGPMPTKLEAVAAIASPDAKALFAKLQELVPPLKSFAIPVDGKLHDIGGVQLPLPFPVSAGVGDKAIVIASGDKRAAVGDKLLAARAVGKAPLFAMSYDATKLIELEMKAMGMSDAQLDQLGGGAFKTMRNLLGRVGGTFDVTDAGLAMWGSVEIK
ncbi:MAG TPA: hypothetical protein VK601_24490, partial [Kofleriaceae bacterium]|nr:hypothetical protein [Kofleriaceae bacterium]